MRSVEFIAFTLTALQLLHGKSRISYTILKQPNVVLSDMAISKQYHCKSDMSTVICDAVTSQ